MTYLNHNIVWQMYRISSIDLFDCQRDSSRPLGSLRPFLSPYYAPCSLSGPSYLSLYSSISLSFSPCLDFVISRVDDPSSCETGYMNIQILACIS